MRKARCGAPTAGQPREIYIYIYIYTPITTIVYHSMLQYNISYFLLAYFAVTPKGAPKRGIQKRGHLQVTQK